MSIRLIQSLNAADNKGKTRTAKIFYCSNWKEFTTKHFIGGVHVHRADASFSHKDDAVEAARHFLFSQAIPTPQIAQIRTKSMPSIRFA